MTMTAERYNECLHESNVIFSNHLRRYFDGGESLVIIGLLLGTVLANSDGDVKDAAVTAADRVRSLAIHAYDELKKEQGGTA